MNILSESENNEAFNLYAELYVKALPGAGELEKSDFEIATFELAENLEDFKKLGLGLKIVSEHSVECGKTLVGHTGKILLNLPFQFMPEHQHRDIDVLPKSTPVPEGYTLVRDVVNDFEGIREYNPDGSVREENGDVVFKFKDSEYTIVMPLKRDAKLSKEVVFHLEGKSETFKMIYGDAIMFTDDAKILKTPVDPYMLPDRFQQKIDEVTSEQKVSTTGMIYLAPGLEVLLPKGTKHSVLGGEEGAVYIEFSTPSMDEADLFTDKRIIR